MKTPPKINLYNVDCMEFMRDLPDNAYDLAIVDPPYGIGNWVQVSGNIRGSAVTWNNKPPGPHYLSEVKRVSKNWIIWGANYYNCFGNNGAAIVWDKGVIRESNMSVCEIAASSYNKRVDCVRVKWQNINRKEKNNPSMPKTSSPLQMDTLQLRKRRR
jgi:site-specific DNA-methyltransferase (adenine-specific)